MPAGYTPAVGRGVERHADARRRSTRARRTAVAVHERSRVRIRRVAVENAEELLGRGELLDRNGHDVVDRVVHHVLIDVVTDAGAVGEQVLDGDAVVDQREVVTKDRAGRGVETELSLLDQTHDRRGSETFRAARDRELCVDPVGDAEAPMGHAVGGLKGDTAIEVDSQTPESPSSLTIRFVRSADRPRAQAPIAYSV